MGTVFSVAKERNARAPMPMLLTIGLLALAPAARAQGSDPTLAIDSPRADDALCPPAQALTLDLGAWLTAVRKSQPGANLASLLAEVGIHAPPADPPPGGAAWRAATRETCWRENPDVKLVSAEVLHKNLSPSATPDAIVQVTLDACLRQVKLGYVALLRPLEAKNEWCRLANLKLEAQPGGDAGCAPERLASLSFVHLMDAERETLRVSLWRGTHESKRERLGVNTSTCVQHAQVSFWDVQGGRLVRLFDADFAAEHDLTFKGDFPRQVYEREPATGIDVVYGFETAVNRYTLLGQCAPPPKSKVKGKPGGEGERACKWLRTDDSSAGEPAREELPDARER